MRFPDIGSRKWFGLSISCLLALLAVGAQTARSQDSNDDAAHTKVGDKMPSIAVQETSGRSFSLTAESGKVVVVNFWATWCGPCQVEMPLLEKDIWQKYKGNAGFAMVAIAREETDDVVLAFQQKHHEFTFPLAADPKRSTYKLFAESGIPRTYVVDRHGEIVYQSLGFGSGDLSDLDRAIAKALSEK